MPRFSYIRKANEQLKLAGKHFLIVGGTSGIGEATAKAIAAMEPASVVIGGRSEASANRVISEMQRVNPNGSYSFAKVDVSSMRDVQRFTTCFIEERMGASVSGNTATGAADFASQATPKATGLDGLFVSPGIMTMQGRTETAEGIDVKLATHYYGRWLLITRLIPLLEYTRSTLGRPGARAVSVLAATKGGALVEDDMDLKRKFSLPKAASQASTMNDLMVNELSLRHPDLGFVHAYPGVVDTPLIAGLPAPMRLMTRALSFLMTSPEDCGQVMAYMLATQPEFGRGWHLLGEKAQPLRPIRGHTDAARQLAWRHTQELVEAALSLSQQKQQQQQQEAATTSASTAAGGGDGCENDKTGQQGGQQVQ